MKYLEVRTNVKKKVGLLALAGAMALPLFATTPSVQAAPRGGWGQRGNAGRRARHRAHTFRGVVTSVKSRDTFDMSMDGKIYNVYLNSRAPRRLNKGDVVEVSGDRVGSNDIRNAGVAIVRNR